MTTNGTNGTNGKPKEPVRCAIYTRKSTSEGLDSDFNTLDAQREAAELYIRSQAGQGWTIVPTHYDDGGFTGGNMDRPALQRLLDDIERGQIDMVVVYKVDRLSRSLLDFSRLVERFEKKKVGFVSITQHFDTSTSMGRLVLNVLLSFAQFERELISERTRDKIQAARRRGKWTGGQVCLGYRVDPDRRALVAVPEEAELVRLIFDMYLRTYSVGRIAARLNEMGHAQKRHVSKDGRTRGGGRWNKVAVHHLLRNALYIGKVRGATGELFAGEHEPIVSLDVFEKVGEALQFRATGRVSRSRRLDFLLTGILRCGPCNSGMSTSTGRGRGQSYRYYRCVRASKESARCPTGLVPADDIERTLITHVREAAKRDDVRAQIRARVGGHDGAIGELRTARDRLHEQVAEIGSEAKRLLSAFSTATGTGGGRLLATKLGEIEVEQDRLRLEAEEIDARLRRVADDQRKGEQVKQLLESFDELWDALVLEEQRELLHVVVERATIDPKAGDVRIKLFDIGDPKPSAANVEEVKV